MDHHHRPHRCHVYCRRVLVLGFMAGLAVAADQRLAAELYVTEMVSLLCGAQA